MDMGIKPVMDRLCVSHCIIINLRTYIEIMRLTIDTEQKTVEIDSAVNIKELTTVLKGLFGDEWKGYDIIANNYSYTPWYPYPYYPEPITFTTTGYTPTFLAP